MNLYAFKQVVEDGQEPKGTLNSKDATGETEFIGDWYMVRLKGQDYPYIIDHAQTDWLHKGNEVLCSIGIDELDEVKQLRERIDYLEQIIRELGYGELL